MIPAHVVEFSTPKGVRLHGLWYGPIRPQRAVIMLHGIAGSAFSLSEVVRALADRKTAVLTFNNRGFGQINTLKKGRGKKSSYLTVGTTHEVFEECVDDIEGAIRYVRARGIASLYLAGHSTGSQKAVYWASRRGRGVKGIILLGPLSDYSIARGTIGKATLQRGERLARRLVAQGTPHALMPSHLREWFECDAQRFLSLYTPDSSENLFTYAHPDVATPAFARITTPILVLLAGADEYGDCPARDIARWFKERVPSLKSAVVIPRANHSFKKAEERVAREVREFMKECG